MDEELEVRARLAAVDVPPSRIELDGLVVAGRRQAFRRRTTQAVGGVAMATALLLAAPFVLIERGKQPAPLTAPESLSAENSPSAVASASATAAPAGSCAMTELSIPPGMKDVSAAAVDPTGTYIVGHGAEGQNFVPVLWTRGQPQALPRAGRSIQLTAVNASGVMVGLLVMEDHAAHVVRYENGTYTQLKLPVGTRDPFPVPAINAAGDIVINAKVGPESEDQGSVAVYWPAGSTTAVRLPLPAGANVNEITDDRNVVGTIYVDGNGVDPYVWDLQGRGSMLKRPSGQTGTGYAARGDWATGGLWSTSGNNGIDPGTALWNIRTGTLTQLPMVGPGIAVNSSGTVVSLEGTVARPGAVVVLAAPAGQTAHAWDIADNELVVGQVQALNNANLGPRVWQC
jgi:hypothetical protein